MNRIRSRIGFPIIVHVSATGSSGAVHDLYVERIKDCTALLNRVIDRWHSFQPPLNAERDEVDQIRLEVIDHTFSFVMFLTLLLELFDGLDKRTRDVMNDLRMDTSSLAARPKLYGTVESLRRLRDKMIAHTADNKPYKDDTMSDRLAYLRWQVGHWGPDCDYRKKRLNTFGLGNGVERSKHAVPPTFDQMIADAQIYIDECASVIARNVQVLAAELAQAQSDEYVSVGFYKV